MTFTDEDIRAYLHGTMTPEDAARLEDVLARDPSLQDRVAHHDPLAAIVKDAFANVPDQKRLTSLSKRLDTFQGPVREVRYYRALLSTACAAGLAGLVIGYVLSGLPSHREAGVSDWKAEVASYHALYVEETVASIDSDGVALASQFAAAQNAIGLDLRADVLSDLDRMTLKRAQVLGFEGAPLVQIAFRAYDGTPMAFCIIRKAESGSTEPPNYGEIQGLASASWASDSHGFLLIGGQRADVIEEIAASLIDTF
ncbi:hypothetical protein [Thalassococcus sp. S3]|uniref:hypothetical protein n=1 Tax=Thalassococcus sp. S3 TaxID=2017482 RepID=UPI0010241C62|nr:hypothetical protein [Thalassococcus sp. S3]QBF33688.1 hypothetical protein CFI11_21080 [Thalassococcus sp. S3]